jgi:hypothetical protein
LENNREEIGNVIKLIAIDTLEEAYRACEYYTLKIAGRRDEVIYKTLSDGAYGTLYQEKDDNFRKQIKRL